jgi:anti-sigma B factor antagonist
MRGTCTATGEIDMATAPSFSADLHDTIDRTNETLVSVDCSAVTFMGSAGYRVLLDATEYAARRGRTLVICNMSRSCARLVGIFGEDDHLTFEPERERPDARR